LAVISQIARDGCLTDQDLRGFVARAFSGEPVDGKRVLCIMPDSTRSMPMPAMFSALCGTLRGRVKKLDFLVALGTHPPMSDDALNRLLGITAAERAGAYGEVGVYNHEWKNESALASIGTISEDEIERLSRGMMRQRAEVAINKRVLDYDLLCVVGPVFPHEVVGFSGGNKYFFPGIAGEEILNLFHWLGALITNPAINGSKHTPVRDVINRAASMIPVERRCFCLNVTGHTTKGIFYGLCEDAWSAAADLSKETHIVYKPRPFTSVLAIAPSMYDDLWVAGKCMYKLEPVVADGGELIILGPHVNEISVTHGHLIRQIGYHTRDYFLGQMERFAHIPGGILAHSTHVRGIGTCVDGVERCRVCVTLATGIPEDVCESINLGYRNPASIRPEEWKDREEEGYLLVPNAGEILYKLESDRHA
jgi:nickel-dependent lactate racemase